MHTTTQHTCTRLVRTLSKVEIADTEHTKRNECQLMKVAREIPFENNQAHNSKIDMFKIYLNSKYIEFF